MSSYLSAKFVFFLKSRLLFNIFYCFCIFVNKHFIYLAAHNSTCKYCYNAKPSADYFYVKTKISIDFQICISVPLTLFFLSNPVPFNGQSYQKQKGPGTSHQSLFRSQNKFGKILLFIIYYLTKFDHIM